MKTQFNAVNHLERLIKEKFHVFLVLGHRPQFRCPRGKHIKMETYADAYLNRDDAFTKGVMPIASARAYCAEGDQFVKSKGMTLALRRLYRTLTWGYSKQSRRP